MMERRAPPPVHERSSAASPDVQTLAGRAGAPVVPLKSLEKRALAAVGSYAEMLVG
jgi:hypothetical protein